jgi:hypothetical protein
MSVYYISSTCGAKTLASILVSHNTSGASFKRIYGHYARSTSGNPASFYRQRLGLFFGSFRNRQQF